MTKRYILKGINSDTETCEQCGKTGLKRVIWLEVLDADGNQTGSTIPMGTCCGAKALGFKGEFKNVEQVAQAVEQKQEREAAVTQAQKMAIEFNDEIAIIKNGQGYVTVRGKAFNANPNRYGMPVQWVS